VSLREKFAALLERAEDSIEYWRDVAITDFARDLHMLMQRRKINHTELADRIGTSRPYITRILGGGNFTLETMVRLSMALGGVVRIHIADRGTVTSWKDEYDGRTTIDLGNEPSFDFEVYSGEEKTRDSWTRVAVNA
jgi:plasmid maintenance system antidote protein VapI